MMCRYQPRRIFAGSERVKAVVEGVYILPAQGRALVVETGDSVVLVDAGPGGDVTRRMIEALRSFTVLPVSAICYSHGHPGCNDGVDVWLQHNAQRNEPAPQLIAHENCPRRYRRYLENLWPSAHDFGNADARDPLQFEDVRPHAYLLNPHVAAFEIPTHRIDLGSFRN